MNIYALLSCLSLSNQVDMSLLCSKGENHNKWLNTKCNSTRRNPHTLSPLWHAMCKRRGGTSKSFCSIYRALQSFHGSFLNWTNSQSTRAGILKRPKVGAQICSDMTCVHLTTNNTACAVQAEFVLHTSSTRPCFLSIHWWLNYRLSFIKAAPISENSPCLYKICC